MDFGFVYLLIILVNLSSLLMKMEMNMTLVGVIRVKMSPVR